MEMYATCTFVLYTRRSMDLTDNNHCYFNLFSYRLNYLYGILFHFSPEITYEYVSEPGECSKTCNRGFLVNNITCLRLVDGMRDGAVDDLFCDEFGVARPPTTEECNIDQCPRWVIESDFSPVSSFSL